MDVCIIITSSLFLIFWYLICSKALVTAKHQPDEWPNIYDNVTGVLFFGTPFRGAESNDQLRLIEAAQLLHSGKVHQGVLRITQPNDELLKRVLREFERLRESQESNRIMITCFFEQKPCNLMSVLGENGNFVSSVPMCQDDDVKLTGS